MDKSWTNAEQARALVTGATGLVGRALVESLGENVVATTRPGVETVVWDARSPLPERALTNVGAVFHLAGEPVAEGRWSKAKKERILRSRVESTRALVDSILALPPSARPKVLVCASAVGIYGTRGDEELDETRPPAEGFLADVCRAWEEEAARAKEGGVRVVSVRIGIVFAAEGGALPKMMLPFRFGLGATLGDGRQWMPWIHLDDLVALLQFAAATPDLEGPMNAAAPGVVRNEEMTRAIARAVRRPAFLGAPAFALRAAMGEVADVVLASQRVVPRVAVQHGFEFSHPTLAEALEHLVVRMQRRKAAHLRREQIIARPLDEVFAFFAEPANLERITPPFLRFRIVTPAPIPMRAGTLIDYRLSLFGVPFGWRTRIEDVKPGVQFVDTQLRGPYSLWRHTHEFVAIEGGKATRMIDHVEYVVPLGPLGKIASLAFVDRTLAKIFDYRAKVIQEIFEDRAPTPAPRMVGAAALDHGSIV
ncbi:MAG: TIGR01777 family oxidoreductase [Deltaproteobacteria bacterium]|nr:TIGR01777 family oxidoreductase [Deltaproteobacteria bacterium]